MSLQKVLGQQRKKQDNVRRQSIQVQCCGRTMRPVDTILALLREEYKQYFEL